MSQKCCPYHQHKVRRPAQDIAAEPAPATPAGGAEESKHCEEEQPEDKMKTDTQMDDVEEEREAPEPRKRGGNPTRHLPAPYSEDYTPIAADAQGRLTITSKHAHTTRSRRGKSS